MEATNPGNPPRFKITADRSKCCGYGLCAQICPQVYALDENGLIVLNQEYVTAELEEEAREGASACPAEVIVVEEVAS